MFQYIQQYQGYIWPGVVAAFVVAFVLPKAPAAAGVVTLIGGPIIYGAFQATSAWHGLHFLIQVLLSFIALIIISIIITMAAPLSEPRKLPVREDMDLKSSRPALIVGAAVIVGVIIFTYIFR